MSLKRTSMPGLSGRSHFWNYTKQSVAILLCISVLSACGPASSLFHGDGEPAATQEANAGTAAPQGDSGKATPMPPLTGPPAPGESGAAFLPNGLPALQPLGVNVDAMFSERIKDEDKRFERVENAVRDMRREFDAVKPSILRLVAVEEDMQELMSQLETLLRGEPPPPADVPVETSAIVPPPEAPADKPPSPAAQSPPAAVKPAPSSPVPPTPPQQPPQEVAAPKDSSGGKAVSASAEKAQVQNLRIGEHDGKTRLVFDVTGPATYRYDIDNGEKLMVIELPGTGWAGSAQWTSAKAPLLASYTVSPLDGGGSRVVVQLKQAASVVYETTIAGGAGEDFRIVIDLKGQ